MTAHYNKAWLQTEYNTAVLRAKTGADFKQFLNDKDVFPNLRWMRTTSVTPREEHKEYWSVNFTAPLDDKFWKEHYPGNEWNCKCWLMQTSDPATYTTPKKGEPTPPNTTPVPNTNPQPGLKGNPAITEQLFSQDHPYYPSKCALCEYNTDGKVHGLKNILHNALKGNCGLCKMANNCIMKLDELCEKLPSYSPIIMQKMRELTAEEKQDFLRKVMNSKDADTLFSANGVETKMFKGHRGVGKNSWPDTLDAARALNSYSKPVTFLQESHELTCADAITEFRGYLVLADFKCADTKIGNTLSKEVAKGFRQAGNVIVYVKEMSEEEFITNVIGYIVRNKDRKHYVFGNLIVVNKSKQIIEISEEDIISNTYVEKLKGFID